MKTLRQSGGIDQQIECSLAHVGSTLLDDMRHHSGQSVVDSREATERDTLRDTLRAAMN